MQKYSKYKDSGVKWLGEIPSHWEVKKLRAAITERKERYDSSESLIILSLLKDKGVIPYDEKGEVGNKSKDDYSQYKVARKGDLVINSMNVIIGSLGISPYNGYISPAYYAFEPKKTINLSYYNYILSLRKVQQSIRCFSKGIMEIRLKISSYDFLSMPFPFPSLEEQNKIVFYLDSAISEIDAAIAQQQKMIDLLNERKQIIINDAVTKGLVPKAIMKDSGIDWIGQIPENWKIRKLKFLLKANLMYGANESAESDDPSFPRYIRITDIDEDGYLKPDTFRSLPPLKAEPYLLDKGDLLFARSGATAGKTYLFNEDIKACFAGYLIKASLKDIMMPEYLNYYTKSGVYDNWKKSIFIQATIPNIGADKYANLLVTLPSKKEQRDIIKYLDLEVGKVNRVVSECKEKIALLQERKQIIINDVVTGKVKVV